MNSRFLTAASAAALAASFLFAPISIAQADGPNDMFQSFDGPGNPNRDICGGSSVANHAEEKSHEGAANVGENGQPQRFETGGRVNDATRENGKGHVADDNCPLG